MNRKKVAKIVLPILGLLLFWVLFKNKIKQLTLDSIVTHFKSFGILYLILGIVIIGLYLYFRRPKKKDTFEPIKEFVDTVPASQILREEFIKGTNMSASYRYSGKDATLHLKEKSDFEIRNAHKWDEPKSGVPMWSCEIHARTGKMKGINYVQIRLDQGLEFIRNNWQSTILQHTPLELHRHNPRKPAVTPQSENIRIEAYRAELLDEGYTKKEVKEIDRFKVRESPVSNEFHMTEEERDLSHQERIVDLEKKKNKLRR